MKYTPYESPKWRGISKKTGRPVYGVWQKPKHQIDGHKTVMGSIRAFTGILDRDGREIYHGDKVETTHGIGTVEWTSVGGIGWYVDIDMSGYPLTDACRVVGID